MNRVLFYVALATISLAGAAAQQIEVSTTQGELISFCSALQRMGIDCTQDSLKRAVNDADPQVRVLAAYALMEKRNNTADVVLIDAWLRELDPHTKIAMAGTLLVTRKDEVGLAYLLNTCSQAQTPTYEKIEATEALKAAGKANACLPSMISTLQSQPDLATRRRILPLFQGVSIDSPSMTSSGVCTLSLQALTDADPEVRLLATNLIANSCNSAAAFDQLRDAKKREKDLFVVTAMSAALSQHRL